MDIGRRRLERRALYIVRRAFKKKEKRHGSSIMYFALGGLTEDAIIENEAKKVT